MIEDENNSKANPYSPPMAKGSSSLPPRVGSFTVGPEQRLVEVFWSYWSGLEVYAVDGIEVLRTKNYQVRGVREFNVGQHKVVIKVDIWPSWRILLRPWQWIAEAYIDDELVVEDVTAEFREKVRSLMGSLRNVLLGLFLLLGILLAVVTIAFLLLLGRI